MDTFPLIPVVGGAAVILLIVVAVLVARSRRPKISEASAKRMQTAGKLGLQYAIQSGWTRDKKWSDGPFGVGSHRRGEDIMFGVYADRPVATFYHSWELVEPRRKNYVVSHMVAGTWIGGDLPLIRVFREQGVHDMPGDIPTGLPLFDQRYRVNAMDEDAVRRAFTANVTRFVLSNDAHVGEFWIQNGWLFTAWEPDPNIAEVVEYRYYLSFLTGLAKMIPERLRSSEHVKGPNGAALAENAARDLFPSLRATVKP